MSFFQKAVRRRAAALAVILAAGLALTACGRTNARTEINAAVTMLQQMEAGDPDEVAAVIRRQQKARMEAERDSLRQQLLDGEIDVWSQFQDYVILGDSRASGFYVYGFLPRERCLAEAGDTIRKMGEHIPDIIALHPARMYVSYGINDINIGFWQTADEYCAEMIEIFDELQQSLPELEIYVNSILEVQDWALSKGENWKYAPDWNVVIREMCLEHGYTYVDNAQLTANNQDLYEGDGIHFKSTFYPPWAANMILATYYRGTEEALDE